MISCISKSCHIIQFKIPRSFGVGFCYPVCLGVTDCTCNWNPIRAKVFISGPCINVSANQFISDVMKCTLFTANRMLVLALSGIHILPLNGRKDECYIIVLLVRNTYVLLKSTRADHGTLCRSFFGYKIYVTYLYFCGRQQFGDIRQTCSHDE